MAFIIEELYSDRQLDFSIDPELLCDLLDQMSADDEIEIMYDDDDKIEIMYDDDDNYNPTILVSDIPAILERLKFTLIPEITSKEKLKISLFAPQPIRMEIVKKEEIQSYVTSSSSG